MKIHILVEQINSAGHAVSLYGKTFSILEFELHKFLCQIIEVVYLFKAKEKP